MSKTEKSVFETLNSINVNDKVEKKSNLTYLSWAWAWEQLKRNYPQASYTIYEDVNGMFYHNDGKSAWVKTGITVQGQEHIEYLPVMDFRNNSITIEKITSVDVNKSIQRSLTKSIARHGLGLYIYANEDLPSVAEELSNPPKNTKTKEATPKKAEPKKVTTIKLDIGDENWTKVLRYVSANKELGLKKIGENLVTKYSMTANVKKEIAKSIA
ncbi:DUF1071 domain-containing protein [bacterium]|nr:DUF1071 domain-containing protein [bacterium]